jgi:hypothetical protein
MTNADSFSTKEIVIDISEKMDRFIERQDKVDIKQDERLGVLEIHRARIMGNFKLIGWLVTGGSALGAIVTGIIKFF